MLGRIFGVLVIVLTLAMAVEAFGQSPASLQVDINNAPAAELVKLPGVGPRRAVSIMRFRMLRPFKRPSDLLRIKGFGRRTYLRIKPFIAIKPVAPAQR